MIISGLKFNSFKRTFRLSDIRGNSPIYESVENSIKSIRDTNLSYNKTWEIKNPSLI